MYRKECCVKSECVVISGLRFFWQNLSFRLLWRNAAVVRLLRIRHSPVRAARHSFEKNGCSGNRRKVASMLQLRLADTSLCQRCRLLQRMQAALTVSFMYPHADEQSTAFCQTLERLVLSEKKKRSLAITTFWFGRIVSCTCCIWKKEKISVFLRISKRKKVSKWD